MKSRDYWQQRMVAVKEAAEQRYEDYIDTLEREFRKASSALEKEVEGWYQRFATNNQLTLAEAKGLLRGRELEELRWQVEDYIKAAESLDPAWKKALENASARAHISRLESLQLQLQQAVEVLYGGQQDGLDQLLREIYREGYYGTAFEIQKGIGVGWELPVIQEKELDRLLKKPWTTDGATFSDRIWKNKKALIGQVQSGLIQGLVRGEPPSKLAQELAHQFGVSRGRAATLAYTESAYFHAQAQKDCYDTLEVERYEVVETLDRRTCEICQPLDGKVFPRSDYAPGITAPPFHPRCRGCTAPYFEDMDGERAARDKNGEGYELVPADMTYAEWKKRFLQEDPVESVKTSDIIKTKCTIPNAKIELFLLKPGAKHADEFFAVGYTTKDVEKLKNDLISQFEESRAIDSQKLENGAVSFSIAMELGVTSKQLFRTVWRREDATSLPRLITAYIDRRLTEDG